MWNINSLIVSLIFVLYQVKGNYWFAFFIIPLVLHFFMHPITPFFLEVIKYFPELWLCIKVSDINKVFYKNNINILLLWHIVIIFNPEAAKETMTTTNMDRTFFQSTFFFLDDVSIDSIYEIISCIGDSINRNQSSSNFYLPWIQNFI